MLTFDKKCQNNDASTQFIGHWLKNRSAAFFYNNWSQNIKCNDYVF